MINENGVKSVVLYLEDWQMQMVKDFTGHDCQVYRVELGDTPVLRYGLPTNPSLKRMYFTEWQIREMKDIAGHACEFVELERSHPIIEMYAITPM